MKNYVFITFVLCFICMLFACNPADNQDQTPKPTTPNDSQNPLANCKIAKIKDVNGATLETFEYEGGKLSKIIYRNGRLLRFRYTPAGKLRFIEHQTVNDTIGGGLWGYHSYSSGTLAIELGNPVIEITFNGQNQIIDMYLWHLSTTNDPKQRVLCEYNNDQNLSRINIGKWWTGSGNGFVDVNNFSYDNKKNPFSVDDAFLLYNLVEMFYAIPNKNYTYCKYFAKNNPLIIRKDNTSPIITYSYEYNIQGYPTKVVENGVVYLYEYTCK